MNSCDSCKIRFLPNNLTLESVLTTTEPVLGGYTVDNLQNLNAYSRWSVSNGSTLTMDWNKEKPVDFMRVYGHTFTDGDTVQMDLFDIGGTLVFSKIFTADGLIPIGRWETGVNFWGEGEDPMFMKDCFAKVSASKAVLTFNLASSVTISTVILGKMVYLDEKVPRDIVETNLTQDQLKLTSASFAFPALQSSSGRMITVPLIHITQADRVILGFALDLFRHTPWYFQVWTETQAGYLQEKLEMLGMTEIKQFTNTDYQKYTSSIKILEVEA